MVSEARRPPLRHPCPRDPILVAASPQRAPPEPVDSGFVASLTRPGRNITGFQNFGQVAERVKRHCAKVASV